MNVSRLAARLTTAVACVSILGLASAGAASANNASSVCTGTLDAPGTLAGAYTNVTINGVCYVDGGPATVSGNLTVSPGSALLAVFYYNDVSGTGTSSLAVNGNITVGSGGILFLGCGVDLNCFDDPTGNLVGTDTVGKNVTGNQPLGMIIHESTVQGNLTETGGGGGLSCDGSAVFPFGVFSDVENTTVGGNLTITGLQSCWFGAERDTATNMTFSGNTFADPDAMEIASNQVSRNLSCTGNSPAAQFGDGGGASNVVGHQASGECGFDVLQPNPADGGALVPMSVMG